MKQLQHLSEIYTTYDTFIIDLWGVMHDGISLNNNAVLAVEKLLNSSKKIVFLSNAPRPSEKVKEFLRTIKMQEKFLKNIVTSGEAAMQAINEKKFGNFFYHIGTTSDESIFYKVKENKTTIENCDFIICTGLFDEHENNLNFYKDLLKNHLSKKLICTNPDLIVHRGQKEEHCAGAIAKIFETLGGTSVYSGKPYKEIYKMCFKDNERALAIGDNLRTDIKGANNLKIDSVFISNGVHRNEFKNQNELTDLLKRYKVEANYFQTDLTW